MIGKVGVMPATFKQNPTLGWVPTFRKMGEEKLLVCGTTKRHGPLYANISTLDSGFGHAWLSILSVHWPEERGEHPKWPRAPSEPEVL